MKQPAPHVPRFHAKPFAGGGRAALSLVTLPLAALLLAGCAGWDKAGATPAERREALGQCEAQAAQVAPAWETYIARPGYWEVSDPGCRLDGRICQGGRGDFRMPEYRTRDAAAPVREAVMEACMRELGWSRREGL